MTNEDIEKKLDFIITQLQYLIEKQKTYYPNYPQKFPGYQPNWYSPVYSGSDEQPSTKAN